MTTARQEAALRVRSLHPPLDQLFAALRADLGLPPRERPVRPAPQPPGPAPIPPPTPAPSPASGAVAAAPDPAVEPPAVIEAEPVDRGPAVAEPAATDAEPQADPDAPGPVTPEPEPGRAAHGEEPDPDTKPPLPHHPVGPDPFAAALAVVVREGGDDADDLALRFVVATEHVVIAAARAGARAALDAGVPGDGDIDGTPIDAVISLMHPYAAEIAALRGSGVEPPLPDPELLVRIRAVARSAGVVAAVRGTGWRAVQRFGDPYCPRWGCYGRNGSILDDARVAAEGLPPYGDGCNCRAEPIPPDAPPDAPPE